MAPTCLIPLFFCIMIVSTDSRRLKSSKLEPSAVIGYQAEKGGPTLPLHNRNNEIDDSDAIPQFSSEQNPGDEELLEELSGHGHRRGHQNEVTSFEDFETDAQTLPASTDLDPEGGRNWDVYQSQQELLGLVMGLTERVQSLQHTMLNIKLQNHYIYKTMKKSYKKCRDAPGDDLAIHSAAQKMDKDEITCPRGFLENSNTNTCYKFKVERISWRMARERCRMDDSDLVTIETKGEQRWIMQQARQAQDMRHCDFWTGASDRKAEGNWRWVANNNALSYSNWNINEPNNGRTGEHCMQMMWVFNWAWNDAHCDAHNACYICETGKIRQQN